MASINDYLSQLQNDKQNLINKLNAKGVNASDDETFTQLIPKLDDLNTGGGDKRYRFYDYDGTLLYQYDEDELQELTELPQPIGHDGLTFQEWNWSLDDLKAEGKETNVGANYITDDGSTRLYVTLTYPRLSPWLSFTQSVASGVSINWGDGSDEEIIANTKVSLSHTFPSEGKYVITLKPIEDCVITIPAGTDQYGGKFFWANNTVSTNYEYSVNTVYHVCIDKIEFGKNVKINGEWAFGGSVNIETISVPNYLRLPTGCFRSLTSLKCFIVPNGITTTNKNIFNSCTSMKVLSLPNGITTINPNLIYDGNSLLSLTFPNSVTTLTGGTTTGNYTFTSHSIKKLTLPKNLKTIGGVGLSQLEAVVSIKVPDGLESIGNSCFYQNYMLTDINIPETVTSIGSEAFGRCFKLKSVQLPTHLTALPNSLFYYCSSLEYIDIPSGVTSLGNYCFSACEALKKVVLPDGLTSIGSSCFYRCECLGELIIPPGVTTIPSQTFNMCYAMQWYDFTRHTEIPTLENIDAFNRMPSSCSILVPYSLYVNWKAAENWSTYANNIAGTAIGSTLGSVGDTLPIADTNGVAITWYSNKECTEVITTITNADDYYYCKNTIE